MFRAALSLFLGFGRRQLPRLLPVRGLGRAADPGSDVQAGQGKCHVLGLGKRHVLGQGKQEELGPGTCSSSGAGGAARVAAWGRAV